MAVLFNRNHSSGPEATRGERDKLSIIVTNLRFFMNGNVLPEINMYITKFQHLCVDSFFCKTKRGEDSSVFYNLEKFSVPKSSN